MTDPDRTRPTPARAEGGPLAGLPEFVGRYRIVSLLGEGGFGRVYRGTDPALNRDVAIKVPLRASLTGDSRERFIREAHAAANIHHANVCPIYDVGADGDVPFLVMRFVAGGTLADLLAGRRSRLPIPVVVAVARKLALGVAAAHLVGVIHRDLKPQNVLWDEGNKQVLVTDFGLARFEGGPALTPDRQVFGTPAYMSPEQAAGDARHVGPLSDVYSLGVILYELLAGQPPFVGTVYEVLWKVTQEDPPPPSTLRPGLDTELERICLRAMARTPADRFESAREFANALGAYTTGRQSGPQDDGITDRPVPLELPPDEGSGYTRALGITEVLPATSFGREVVMCPDCEARLEVSTGRTQLIRCPRCLCYFAPEIGRETSRRTLRASTDTRRARLSHADDAPGRERTEVPRSGPNWMPAICGLLLSWFGTVVAIVSSLFAGVLLIVARYRATSTPADQRIFQLPGSEPSDEIPFSVRFAPVVALCIAACGRWLAASVPHPSKGSLAARTAAVLLIAAAGAVIFGLVAESPRDQFHSPEYWQSATAIVAVLILVVMSEFALAYYFTAVGRQLGPDYPRRAVKVLRTGMVPLVFILLVEIVGIMVVRRAGYSGRVELVAIGLGAILACLATLLLIVSLFRSMSVHARVVSEMWNDARGLDD